jgi:hypothetical protein
MPKNPEQVGKVGGVGSKKAENEQKQIQKVSMK